MANMMKQMQSMQAKLMEAQNKIAAMEVTGKAGNGDVSVTIDGNSFLKSVKINPAIQDTEMIEDLIIAAFNDAREELERQIKAADPFKGVVPPGLNLPF